jgi:hypothetical protein
LFCDKAIDDRCHWAGDDPIASLTGLLRNWNAKRENEAKLLSWSDYDEMTRLIWKPAWCCFLHPGCLKTHRYFLSSLKIVAVIETFLLITQCERPKALLIGRWHRICHQLAGREIKEG